MFIQIPFFYLVLFIKILINAFRLQKTSLSLNLSSICQQTKFPFPSQEQCSATTINSKFQFVYYAGAEGKFFQPSTLRKIPKWTETGLESTFAPRRCVFEHQMQMPGQRSQFANCATTRRWSGSWVKWFAIYRVATRP